MSESKTRFEELMQAVRQGSGRAAQEILDTYGGHILRVIRRNLHRRLRSQFDSADFQQAVWASFFAMPSERFTFKTPEDLALFLGGIASNKVVGAFRHRMQTDKQNLNHVKFLEDVGVENPGVGRGGGATPSQVAVAAECWENLLQDKNPVVREMLQLLRDGHTYDEVASRTGLHLKAIQRYVRQLRKGLQR